MYRYACAGVHAELQEQYGVDLSGLATLETTDKTGAKAIVSGQLLARASDRDAEKTAQKRKWFTTLLERLRLAVASELSGGAESTAAETATAAETTTAAARSGHREEARPLCSLVYCANAPEAQAAHVPRVRCLLERHVGRT